MSSLSDYLATALIGHVFQSITYDAPLTIYLALYTDDEGTEVDGGSYARQAISFDDPPEDGAIANSAGCTFSNMPECTITNVALVDDVVDGNVLVSNSIAARDVSDGDDLNVNPGDITVTLA